MPANKRARKTSRGLYDVSQFEAAYAEILNGKSIRLAAKQYGINYITLQRYKKKRLTSNFPLKVGYASNNYFTTDLENVLTKHLEEYSEIYPGLCARVVRKYASEFSQKIGVKVPESWVNNGISGLDWYKNFMHRNNALKQKVKIVTAKQKVKVLYDRLWNIFVHYNVGPENIYCIAEIGVNIEEFRDKIWLITTKNSPIALKESQVRFTYAANAAGFTVPPQFYIPRKKNEKSKIEVKTQVIFPVEVKTENIFPVEVKTENVSNETTFSYFIENGVDLKNLPDWTEDCDFLVFLRHFKKHLKYELGPKVLLMIENQTFHLSIECMEYCKENDIILLVIPGYMTQNIEPLGPITFPLKKTISSLYNALVLEKPERKKSIYNIPSLVSKGLSECLKPETIQDGFRTTGIYPYNREIIINGL